MSQPLVLINHDHPRITIISLNRPEKRNALNIELTHQFCHAIEETHRLPKQRALIIRGEGPIFCSGLDLQEAQDFTKEKQSADLIAQTLTLLYTSHLATIAVVHGAALAGGAGIMSVCDFVVSHTDTIFGFPEIKRGLVAAQIMPFLCRQLRQREMRELLLLGDLFNARGAKEMGLVNRIVSTEELIPEAMKIAEIVIQGAPNAFKETKRLIDAMYPTEFKTDLEKGLALHHQVRHSVEAKEGTAAFLEHREPRWD